MTTTFQGPISNALGTTEKSTQAKSTANNEYIFSAKSKVVSFSKYSTKQVYLTDPYYERWKSYSTAEQKKFRKEAAHEICRIQHLVSTVPLPTARAIHELMKQGLLTREDLLGIEHLVTMDIEKATFKRRSYINLVLGVQAHMQKKYENKVKTEILAAVAVAKSSKMIEKARLRAALAL